MSSVPVRGLPAVMLAAVLQDIFVGKPGKGLTGSVTSYNCM